MATEHLSSGFDSFRNKNVLIVGDVMLDEWVSGEVHRVSPEAPVPIIHVNHRAVSLGGAGNTAANIVGLGGGVFVGGVVGRDREGKLLKELYRAVGIATPGLLFDSARATTVKTRIVGNGQQIVRIDCEDKLRLRTELENRLLQWSHARIKAADACVLSDYGKGVVTVRLSQRLIRVARLERRPSIVDPKGTDWRKYLGATVIKPNLLELQHFLGRQIVAPPDWQWAGNRLSDLLPGTSFLVSRGGDGMTLLLPGRRPLHIHAVAREVSDVTGAGDTAIATLSLALASGIPIELASRLANHAAGIAVGKRGTTTVTAYELRDSIGMLRYVDVEQNGDRRQPVRYDKVAVRRKRAKPYRGAAR